MFLSFAKPASCAQWWRGLLLCGFLLSPALRADQIIYNGSLLNGWANWSWATVNLTNTSPVYSNEDYSISVSCGGNSALYLENNSFAANLYTDFTFWINGGTNGGQSLTVFALTNGFIVGSGYTFTAPSNSWQQVVVAFSTLGLSNQANVDGFWIFNGSGSTLPTFFVGDIVLATTNSGELPVVAKPVISPTNVIFFGSTPMLTSAVTGSQPLSFQWQTDGGGGGALTNIPGATSSNLSYAPLNTGPFQFNLVAANSFGVATSATATLTVLPLAGPASVNDANFIYTIQLNNGWADDYSYAPYYATNFAASNSIACAFTGWQALWFTHDPVNTTIYNDLTFWLNGGPTGGQSINVIGQVGSNFATAGSTQVTAPSNMWKQFTIPLSTLGVANVTNLTGFQFSNPYGQTQSTFYVTGMELTGAPKPAVVHVGVNAAKAVRTVSARLVGANNVAWDGSENGINNPGTLDQLTNAGIQALRWPGGSWGDGYHWTNELWNYGSTSPRYWGSYTPDFIQTATNARAQAFIIANYGSSTPQEAAYGVAEMNITNHAGFKYWEIGNEVGGSWELDCNTNAPDEAHDPWTYAMRFAQYYTAMKAVDPTIKIGAVADTTEDGTINNYNHPAVNPVTGITHYGWTPVMLYTMRTNNPNALPDFLIDHSYAPADGDTYDLLWSSTHWQTDAANLRMMLNDYIGYYLGTNISTNIELDVTEFGTGGSQQNVNLVGGLFAADVLGDIMQTEFNTALWWDQHNGVSTLGMGDNALFGWRTNATGQLITDGGFANGPVVPPSVGCYPSFYGLKLIQYFARGGDTVVTVTNDYALLGTYAAQRTNGSLSLLVINKSSSSNLTAQIALAGYVPSSSATVYSYGIPQDQAAKTGIGSLDIVQTTSSGVSTNFSYTFPPYSANVLVFAPAAPLLVPLAEPQTAPGQFVFQVNGQSNVPYVIQSCTNLESPHWVAFSTNTSAAGAFRLTNSISPVPRFYRAVWQR